MISLSLDVSFCEHASIYKITSIFLDHFYKLNLWRSFAIYFSLPACFTCVHYFGYVFPFYSTVATEDWMEITENI